MGIRRHTELDKWTSTIKVGWSNHLAYRLNFVLQILGPAIVFFFIKYNLWCSVYANDPHQNIQGYSLSSMLEYQVFVLVISLLGQGSNSMNLAEDIRMGRISAYLVYPFDFWKFHFASFLGFQGLQLLITTLTLGLVLALGFITSFNPVNLSQGLFLTILVGFYWFGLQYLIGLLAFWLEETWILRVILLHVAQFLSGAIIPLELYPDVLRKILYYTPFPYLTFVPTKIFMGQSQIATGEAALVLVLWSLPLVWLCNWVWKRGLRLYTAAGM